MSRTRPSCRPSNPQATGKLDFRRMQHVIGGHGPAAPSVHMAVTQSASLPVLTFDARKFVSRKVRDACGQGEGF